MKKIIIAIFTVIFAVNLAGCNFNKLTDGSLREILEQDSEISSLMDLSTATIKAVEDLENESYDKFVLFSAYLNTGKRGYCPIFINTKEKLTYQIVWEAPLSNVMRHVLLDEDEETNIAVFNEMAECVKASGMDCFLTEENAIDFVNDITVKKDIIDIKTARATIADQIISAFGDKSSDEVKVFYEKGTAIPKYYAVQVSESVYRWDSLNIPESIYPYWSQTNRDSELLLEGMYGPAYGLETAWKVVDIQNSEELSGSYDSIKDIKEKFDVDDQETISGASAPAPVKTSVPGKAEDSAKENVKSQTEDLYRSDLVYKRMDDIHNSELTDDALYNEITNVIMDFDEKCESYINNGTENIFQYLVSGTTAYNQQTDYKKKHPNLTQHYNSVTVRTTRKSDTYYYAWVKENMTQTENGVTKTVEDNWVYKLCKEGDKWYINDYTKDPLSS